MIIIRSKKKKLLIFRVKITRATVRGILRRVRRRRRRRRFVPTYYILSSRTAVLHTLAASEGNPQSLDHCVTGSRSVPTAAAAISYITPGRDRAFDIIRARVRLRRRHPELCFAAEQYHYIIIFMYVQ